MVQYLERYKRNIAADLRRRGFSYSEIEERTSIPRSTLHYWLKNITLTTAQRQRLEEKRLAVARMNAERKIEKTDEAIKAVLNSSVRDVQKISKRELWLMGTMLCWGNSGNPHNGLHFTSSNPNLIKFFLRWLREIGQFTNDEFMFDIFAQKQNDDVVGYWSKATGFPSTYFPRVYYGRLKNPLLRVRVKASSLLARQVSGWIKGIQNITNHSNKSINH